MKTKTKAAFRRFELRISAYGQSYYIDRIGKLERVLARKPSVVQIDMLGVGEISADLALLIRSIFLGRSPKTRIVTNARSTLRNGSVLVWLLGDRRLIRDDARIYFRKQELSEEEKLAYAGICTDEEPRYRDSYSEIDPEEADHTRVLQLIDEFLPVKELAGRLIGVQVLKQFGLIENEPVDNFLATVFSKNEPALIFN
jgi:hypothetical protein